MNTILLPWTKHIDKLMDYTNRYWWVWFSLLALAEYLFFRTYALREIAPYYPFAFDQASYLPISYELYENILHKGLISGIQHSTILATGPLFPLQTVFFFFLTSASRLNAITINLIYYVLFQLAVFLTVRHLFKNIHMAIIALAVLLMIKTPFFMAGSLYDYRMDFLAFCLYGIFIACVLVSDIFTLRKWAIIAGLVAAWLILLRAITAVYLGTIYFLFFIILVYCFFKTLNLSEPSRHLIAKKRLFNLTVSGIIVLLLTFPALWLNRQGLYNYYVVNHVLGKERIIRAIISGTTTFYADIIYYPTFLFNHLNKSAGYSMLIVMVIFITFIFIQKKLWATKSFNPVNLHPRISLLFLILSLFVPLFFLTLDEQKSSVVASILVSPFFWLFVYSAGTLAVYNQLFTNYPRLFAIGAYALLITSLNFQVKCYTDYTDDAHINDLKTINRMSLAIGDYATSKKWPKILISFDHMSAETNSGVLKVLYYEYRGKLLTVNTTKLGNQIFSISKEDALKGLEKSNVAILTTGEYQIRSPFPFEASIKPIAPLLQHYAQTHFISLGDYSFMGQKVRVYVRDH